MSDSGDSLIDGLLGTTHSLSRRRESFRVADVPGGLFGRGQSAAGVWVDEEAALSLSAIFAGVVLYCDVVGALPIEVYRPRPGGDGSDPALDHAARRLLRTSPNVEMTAAVFRGSQQIHRLLWGNSYAEISWAGSGEPAALWPIQPWRVQPWWDEFGSLTFIVDGTRHVHPEDMLHVPHVSFDGVRGRGLLDFAGESLGLSLATQDFAARYFGNGAKPGGLLRHPGTPKSEARSEFKRDWNNAHQGADSRHGTAIVYGGWEYVPLEANDAQEAQLLEQRRFTVEECARWLNIPPHLLRDLSRATFSNIEHQGIDFVTYSLGPVLVRYEQEYDRKLFGAAGIGPAAGKAAGLYVKHNVNGLMRGDHATRGAFYTTMFNIGVYSPNDIARLEDRNPVPGGDVRLVPLNMQRLEDAGRPQPATDAGSSGDGDTGERQKAPPIDRRQALQALRGLLGSALARMARVEANALRRAAHKPSEFLPAIEALYDKHRGTLTEALAPVFTAAAALGLRCGTAEALADLWCDASREMMLKAAGECRAAELSARVDTETSLWLAVRVPTTANNLPEN